MDDHTTPPGPRVRAGQGAARHRPYPGPVLWPVSSQLRVGAAITIAVVLGVVLVLYFRPWESSGGSTPPYNPYGLGRVASVFGGEVR